MKTALFLSALISLSSIGFASENMNKESEKLIYPGKFYGLVINSNANIILTQGEGSFVKIMDDNNDLKNISAEVKNGTLILDGVESNAANIFINTEEINFIEINGSARVFVRGSIYSDILLLKVNGNGSMKLDVRSLSVIMMMKGNGKIIISGSTGESYVKVFGNGIINVEALNSINHTEARYAYKLDVELTQGQLLLQQ